MALQEDYLGGDIDCKFNHTLRSCIMMITMRMVNMMMMAMMMMLAMTTMVMIMMMTPMTPLRLIITMSYLQEDYLGGDIDCKFNHTLRSCAAKCNSDATCVGFFLGERDGPAFGVCCHKNALGTFHYPVRGEGGGGGGG
jgi:hypothetical protein